MKSEIKYIELKSGYSDDGPAWIGKVDFSKTGQTVYFNGQAFKGNGHGLCFDVETKETYWITGIKKDGENRHWAGKGKIMIDKTIVDDFLKIKGWSALDLNKYDLIEVAKTDKQRFKTLENSRLIQVDYSENNTDLEKMSPVELKRNIVYLISLETYTNSNNGLKFLTAKRLEAERLLEQHQINVNY